MAYTTATTTAYDQEKYLHAALISRSLQRLQCGSVLESVKLPDGTGTTGYFVRYERTYLPWGTLTEGTVPSDNSMSLTQVTVTVSQYGDKVTITDVAQLTTKHPLVEEATKLLADSAQRLIDSEIQKVFLAGTNVQYGDGTVTTRPTLTTSLKLNAAALHKARVTMVNNGAPPRGGPSGGVELGQSVGGMAAGKSVASAKGQMVMNGMHYVAICGAAPLADLAVESTNLGGWVGTAMYRNPQQLYNFEAGSWLGFRWIETNFIPKFRVLGSTTAAVASGNAFGTNTPVVTAVDGGGALDSGVTYFYKVSRIDKLRNFEEEISVAHSTASAATGDNESFTFNFSGLTAGFRYKLYFDTEQGGGDGTDAKLRLVDDTIEVGDTVTVAAVASGTADAAPPTTCAAAGTSINIHPIYICAEDFGSWVYLQPLEMKITGDAPTIGGNELGQLKSIGYKFMGKAVIKDQLRILRLEVYSAY